MFSRFIRASARKSMYKSKQVRSRCRPSENTKLILQQLENREMPAVLGLVSDINPGGNGSNPGPMVAVGSTLYFVASDGSSGNELWKTNGSARATVLVKDINGGGLGSDPQDLIAVGSTLYFTADDGIHGRELWKTDGTTAGTVLVKDLVPGGATGFPNWREFATNGSSLYFVSDADGNASQNLYGYDLWKSDGTAVGTVVVKTVGANEIINGLTFFKKRIYFGYISNSAGLDVAQLWKSDGTQAGTVSVSTIGNPSHSAWIGGPMCVAGDELFFRAGDNSPASPPVSDDPDNEPWVSDGTTNGTHEIELSQDNANSNVGSSLGFNDPLGPAGKVFVQMGGSVYFSAFGHSAGLGAGLYRIDSTALTPVLLTRGLQAGVTAGPPFAAGNRVFFILNSSAHVLAVTDGTEAGTQTLASLVDPPPWAAAIGNTLFFSTFNFGQGGQEMWSSDGTISGTHLAFDVYANGSSSPAFPTVIGQAMYFSADDGPAISGGHGRELWRYGPPIGRLLDINDGSVQRSMVNSITLTFNGLVNFSGSPANAFSVVGPGGAVTVAVDLSGSTPKETVAKLTFSGSGIVAGSLADGNYTLTVFANQITDADGAALDGDFDGNAGGNYTSSFYRLFGDANGDRHVDVADAGLLSLAYGSNIGDPNYAWYFDYNNDGHIDIIDYGQFSLRYGTYLAP